MPTDWLICESIGGASSFGATGIIAHTLLQYAEISENSLSLSSKKNVGVNNGSKFRLKTARSPGAARRLYVIPVSEKLQGPELGSILIRTQELVFVGHLSFSANVGFSDHVIHREILLPGVGYAEMAFSYNTDQLVLTTVAFLRPCVLTELQGQRLLRQTKQNTGMFEISS